MLYSFGSYDYAVSCGVRDRLRGGAATAGRAGQVTEARVGTGRRGTQTAEVRAVARRMRATRRTIDTATRARGNQPFAGRAGRRLRRG